MIVRIEGELTKRLVKYYDEQGVPYPVLNSGEKFMRVKENYPIIFLERKNV